MLTYHSRLFVSLCDVFGDTEISSLTSTEIGFLLNQCIPQSHSVKSTDDVVIVILQFYSFLSNKYCLSELPEEFKLSISGNRIIAAKYIPKKLYQHSLKAISEEDIPEYKRKLLRVILILGYRLGLRLNELVGLEIADLITVNKEIKLVVRPNNIRDLKTRYSKRKFY